MLASQKNPNDTQGLEFEKGESSKSLQQKNNSRKLLIRQPNANKFNGNILFAINLIIWLVSAKIG